MRASPIKHPNLARRDAISTLLLLKGKWRVLFIGVSVTALVPLLLHMNVHQEHMAIGHRRQLNIARNKLTNHHLPLLPLSQPNHLDSRLQTVKASPGSIITKNIQPPPVASPWDVLARTIREANKDVVDFFHGEPRALEDGIPFGGTHDKLKVLAERLADRIAQCHGSSSLTKPRNNNNKTDCTLRVVFVGGGQVSGRDIFKNQTYPYQAEPRLRSIAKAAGLELEVLNRAMDSDLSREGPQSLHMCLANLAGSSVDILGWDSESTMQGNPSAQVEAFVRWASTLKPALIMFNRGGPHARSRRGVARSVVNLVGTHDAIVYDDKPEDIPEPREEPYRNSSRFDELWANQRNSFWETIFDKYSPFIDFAGIDPSGSIWHLDHLKDFSNGVFEEGKALPLYDCPAPSHPPPCDQIPAYVIRHLAKENRSIDSLPRDDTSGAFCGVETGCRHAWYGGPRSHALRAALNALPIVRAFESAVQLILSREREDSTTRSDHRSEKLGTNSETFSIYSLPAPQYCSKKFCSMTPTCISAYVPNVGLQLGSAILFNETFPTNMPRLGACHYAHNPEFAVRNLDRRFAPLGWDDRKYAYRLAQNDPNVAKKKKKKKKNAPTEAEDSSTTAIGFVSTGPGPLVLCEPPCFIDECSPKRKRPLVKHIQLHLDGEELPTPNSPPPETEIGGVFCRVIAKMVPAGQHILRISTEAVAPDHVLFSSLISFA